MLTCFDRILLCLEKIPNTKQQEAFLAALPTLDITEGGVPYAMRHEGFVIGDASLQLSNFHKGNPTYAPDIAQLNSWAGPDGTLFMHRALALQGGISPQDYQYIITHIVTNCSNQSKANLLWVLHSQFADAAALDAELTSWAAKPFFGAMATHFFKVFYIDKIPSARFPLDLFTAIEPDFSAHTAQWQALLTKYPNVMLLECLQALHVYHELDVPAFARVRDLFDKTTPSTPAHPHMQQGFMLATVFGADALELQQFYDATKTLKGVVRQELSTLSTQLLSLDLPGSKANLNPAVWVRILQGIHDMNAHPTDTAQYRIALITDLVDNYGLTFKSSLAGDYHVVDDADLNTLIPEFKFFEQHEARLKDFFKTHIAISTAKGARPSLLPIMDFFKRLQLNKTYINEIEPLLATLESLFKAHPSLCWTAEYFNSLLRALQSKEDNAAFPIAILEAVLTEKDSPFWPKDIDHLEITFPDKLADEFKFILSKGESFNRPQQTILAKLALRAQVVGQDTALIRAITERLMQNDFEPLRGTVLTFLLKGNIDDIELNFNRCEALIELAPNLTTAADAALTAATDALTAAIAAPAPLDPAAQVPLQTAIDTATLEANKATAVEAHWSDTCQLWMETFTKTPELYAELLEKAKTVYTGNNEKLALVLHIVAWSSIPSDTLLSAPRTNYLAKGKSLHSKTEKLIERLQTFSEAELRDLATKYPAKPAPDTKHLLDFIKIQSNDASKTLATSVNAFLLNPDSAAKRDYEKLAITREQDFQRMLEDTRVTRGEDNTPLDAKDSFRLTMMFKLLKQLESGQACLPGVDKAITEMTQEELAEAFKTLSAQSKLEPDNDVLCTQIWAVLFAVLGRTSGKYPHLAQQFSLIANEIALKEDPSSILQLKTGEGKSHFVAMRAARHVGLGKNVDVCTAKWSLAERDLIDYKPFFDYLDIKTANVKATSTRDTYEQAQIVYTTPGDLSLFLDAQAFAGDPITIRKNKRVGLGDEFDFLFYEGQKTQYNYAQHTGITPKEMVWFYRALNEFYDTELRPSIAKAKKDKKPFNIKADDLSKCFTFLTTKANTDEGFLLLNELRKKPIELVGWIQSAYEAAKLKMGEKYTVRLERVKIGDEEYPLKEVYPLTKDMQAAVGSTFSHGVHQLLAERLNQAAKANGEAQNYHVHPESHIVSSQVFSQRLKTLWDHWEGFTGTVSAAQAAQLHNGFRTAVLRVPTNQKDLRKWPEPTFCDNDAERLKAMANTIKQALKEKKSILWCCATDKEVNEMVTAIKPFFTDDEFNTHFMSYTNESHDSAAEVLQQKKTKEGLVLGQKERGVVLIAAGFGRGDNVDVEMVLLGSVHDENDLGQKGGRTARNGEEGEVRQFYLKNKINGAFSSLLTLLRKEYPAESADILVKLHAQESSIDQTFFDGAGKPDQDTVKALSPKFKFDTLLRLQEFLQAIENQASLAYHEAKAQISSVAIAELGNVDLDPIQRKEKAQGFANHLAALESQWIKIQAEHTKPQDRIEALHTYLNTKVLGSLARLFHEENPDYKFPFHREDLPALTFLLEPEKTPRTEAEMWLTEIQNRLLHIEDWPADAKIWQDVTTCIADISKNRSHKLKELYTSLQQEPSLTYKGFIGRLDTVRKQIASPAFDEASMLAKEALKKKLPTTLRALANTPLGNDIDQLMKQLQPDAQKAVSTYLNNPGLVPLTEHASRVLPMLQYIASMKPEQALQAKSYFSQIPVRDALLDLPVACFKISLQNPQKPTETMPLAMHASHMLLIKKFLDRSLPSTFPEDHYVVLFERIAKGCQHQTEKRLRWLATFETMLDHSNNKPTLLDTLSTLMLQFESAQNFVFFQELLNKISALYTTTLSLNGADVDTGRLDSFWKHLLQKCPDILQVLPTLEKMLKQRGKEFFFDLEAMVTLSPAALIVDFEPLFTEFLGQARTTEKHQHIGEQRQIVDRLQQWSNSLPADGSAQPEYLLMQGLSTQQLMLALNTWEQHAAIFSQHRELFCYYVAHLKVSSPPNPQILPLLIQLSKAKNAMLALDLESCLLLLDVYKTHAPQLSKLTQLMQWHTPTTTASREQAVTEFWMRPDRIQAIASLGDTQYAGLQTAYTNAAYRKMFVEHPEVLDTFIAYLGSASFDTTKVNAFCVLLNHLLVLKTVKTALDIPQHLAQLQAYSKDQLARLSDLMQWHTSAAASKELAITEFWMKPVRIQAITALTAAQYAGLQTAYTNVAYKKMFVEHPEVLDTFIPYLGSASFDSSKVDSFCRLLIQLLMAEAVHLKAGEDPSLHHNLSLLKQYQTNKKELSVLFDLMQWHAIHPSIGIEARAEFWRQPSRIKSIAQLGVTQYRSLRAVYANPTYQTMFVEHPEILDTFIAYLRSASFDETQVNAFCDLLNHLLAVKVKQADLDIQQHLAQLTTYSQNALARLSNLVQWHTSTATASKELAIAEFWMKPARMQVITALSAAQYAGLQAAYTNVAYKKMFVEHPEVLDTFIAYLGSASFDATRVNAFCDLLNHLLVLKAVKTTLDIPQHLVRLQAYLKDQLARLSDLIKWHTSPTSASKELAIAEFWMKPARIQAITLLTLPRYTELQTAYTNPLYKKMFVEHPETVDSFIAYLGSAQFDASQVTNVCQMLKQLSDTKKTAERVSTSLEMQEHLTALNSYSKTELAVLSNLTTWDALASASSGKQALAEFWMQPARVKRITQLDAPKYKSFEKAYLAYHDMFVHHPEVLDNLIDYLNSPSYPATPIKHFCQLLSHLLKTKEHSEGTIEIAPYLISLTEYQKQPAQFSVLTDLIEWHKDNKQPFAGPALAEFWMQPAKVAAITQLKGKRYSSLRKAYENSAYQAMFVEYPVILDALLNHLHSNHYKSTQVEPFCRLLTQMLSAKTMAEKSGSDFAIPAHLTPLLAYTKEQLAVLSDLMQWHITATPSSEGAAITKFWIQPDRVRNIAFLDKARYADLKASYENPAYQQMFMENPLILDTLVDYLGSQGFNATQLDTFCQLLHKMYQTDTPKQMTWHLDRLQTIIADSQRMNILLGLIKDHPQYMMEIADNNVALYLKEDTAEQCLTNAVNEFYTQRTESLSFNSLRHHFTGKSAEEPNVAGANDLTAPLMHPMFDLDNVAQAPQRCAWLQLLHSDVFVPEKASASKNAWSASHNDILLSDGLSHYTKHAKKVLAPSGKKHQGSQKIRGLTTAQQQSLLHMTHELTTIGTPPASIQKTAAKQKTHTPSAALEQEMKLALKKYKNTWFKNITRRKQIRELETRISEFLLGLHGSKDNKQVYPDLLKEIHAAKRQITLADAEASHSIFRWFRPLHKKGHSRLHTTLNMMQDAVLRSWAADVNEVLALPEHTPIMNAKLSTDALHFWEKLQEWHARVDMLKNQGGALKTAGQALFFSQGSTAQEAVATLHGMIEGQIDSAADDQAANIIAQVLSDNKALMQRLPGELRTVGKEVLAVYVDEQLKNQNDLGGPGK
ncbi:MAG: hypothetical protein Q8R79_07090 [Legionellaceae bacterium]|nr:hypothetical protein [Legionellaceae bacterium]